MQIAQVRDSHIHLLAPGFNLPSKVPIGGVDPLEYGVLNSPPGSPNSKLFHISGSVDPTGYAAAEWFWNRPVQPSIGKFRSGIIFRMNAIYPKFWQAFELDVKLTLADGLTRNFSQEMLPYNSMVQVSGQDSGWNNAANLPTITPDVPHTYIQEYEYDPNGNTYSSAVPSLDSKPLIIVPTYPALTAYKEGPAGAPGWPVGAVVQFQITQTLLAGGIEITVDDLWLEWDQQ
jgi:hypothetical protein